MADIELVVKIPEEIRLALINNIQLSLDQQSICDSCVKQAIINGTPLPRFHGRLGDLDALREEVCSWGMNDYEPSDFTDEIDRADTIIEASKEYETKVITRGNCMMCGKELTEGLFFCKECEAKATQDRK